MRPSILSVLCLIPGVLAVACEDQIRTAGYVTPVFAEPCRFVECGPGVCHVTEEDAPECLCPVGYQGAKCESCESSFHRNALGQCANDTVCSAQSKDPCAPAGHCSQQDGVIACSCDQGYEGPRCTLCADRYARDPLDRCLPVYLTMGGALLDAGGASSTALAGDAAAAPDDACPAGYTGGNCATCSLDYHRMADSCVLDEVCRPTSCPANASCAVAMGLIQCTCDQGYTGATCNKCEMGYHRDNGDCVVDQTCIASSCPLHAACAVQQGRVACTCNAGYQGQDCATCAPDYHAENGACVPGPSSCPLGYHVVGTGCVQDETCQPSSCLGHASCRVIAGLVACSCDPGWGPANQCNLCAQYASERSGFEFADGWPSGQNVCVERKQLAVSRITFSSRVGTNGAPEGPVMLCAPSTYSKMASQHIQLEVYKDRPATLVFERAASTVVLDYGASVTPVAVDVYAYPNPVADANSGGQQVASLTLEAKSRTTLSLEFRMQVRELALRSRTSGLQTIALDDLVYTYPDCE